MAGWRRLVAVGGALLALTLASGAGYRPAVSSQPHPAVELSVTVVGGDDEVVTGRPVTYAIGARNRGRRPVDLLLRVSVPPRMYEVTPHGGGTLTPGGVVDWPVTVPAGRAVSVHLTGVYGPAESDEPREVRVAVTACALDPEEGQPVVCATSVGLTTPGDVKWPYGLLLVVAVGAFAGTVVWRRRHPGGPTWFRRAARSGLRFPRARRGRPPGPGPTPGSGRGTGPAPDPPPGGSPPPPPPVQPAMG